jgi:glycerol-3-phosphate acyltransferase PlsX
VLLAFKHRVDPRRHNGATLIGLKGVVVKSHGSADALAFKHALRKAYAEAAHGVLDKIAQHIATMPALAAQTAVAGEPTSAVPVATGEPARVAPTADA